MDLKRCPCCGAKVRMVSAEFDMGKMRGHRVFCDECRIHTGWYDTPELAAQVWNRRDGHDQTNTGYCKGCHRNRVVDDNCKWDCSRYPRKDKYVPEGNGCWNCAIYCECETLDRCGPLKGWPLWVAKKGEG